MRKYSRLAIKIGLLVSSAILLSAILHTCISVPENGNEGQPCFNNGKCNGNLVCKDNICVKPLSDGGTDGGLDGGEDAGTDAGQDGGTDSGIPSYQLTVQAGIGGTTIPSGIVTVNHGDQTPISATAGTGYHFINWSSSGSGVVIADTDAGSTNVILTGGNATVSAAFAIYTYTLDYYAGPNGSIIGTAHQVVDYGDAGTVVTADAGTGYKFIKWSDDSIDNPRTDSNVMSNISVTADFDWSEGCFDYGGRLGEMCNVLPGSFMMGCNCAEQNDGGPDSGCVDSECFYYEKPYHSVTFSHVYLIDKYEVTVNQYSVCVTDGGCSTPGDGGHCNWGRAGYGNNPINCVDWNQSKAYCLWAGKRLPSEAEWERGARSEDSSKYPWGNTGLDCDHAVCSYPTTRPECDYSSTGNVGQKPLGISSYGMMDMIGNVSEWLEDDWHDNYNGAPSDGSPWIWTPTRSNYRIMRGGCWDRKNSYPLRSSVRDYAINDAGPYSFDYGFRCAKSDDAGYSE